MRSVWCSLELHVRVAPLRLLRLLRLLCLLHACGARMFKLSTCIHSCLLPTIDGYAPVTRVTPPAADTRVQVVHVIGDRNDVPPSGPSSIPNWDGEVGWIDEERVRKYCFPPSE